ncbi:hypothetical protein K9U34_05095 [Lawsonia intracellularis]|uniref:hypothetical protein n=1 Tax=Lawsonia intracellularis TaxID=29546 RepID=UPI0003073756|nr:hypothetical protein [Lawsonia intracellularis]MBZ3892968.1 hypothetical protein [Lawsonia intracellularis]UYH52826.1 hypothetical protein OCT60_05970 [Lawsonia intracellularis]
MIGWDSVLTGGIIIYTIIFVTIKLFRLKQSCNPTKKNSCTGCTSNHNCCSIEHSLK